MRSVADKVALEQVLVEVLRFHPCRLSLKHLFHKTVETETLLNRGNRNIMRQTLSDTSWSFLLCHGRSVGLYVKILWSWGISISKFWRIYTFWGLLSFLYLIISSAWMCPYTAHEQLNEFYSYSVLKRVYPYKFMPGENFSLKNITLEMGRKTQNFNFLENGTDCFFY
jgi:hypothetical protein